MSASGQRLALRDAARWHARLGAAPHCLHTRGQWQAWHQQDALHQWAWQQLEDFRAELCGVPSELARRTLASDLAQPARRTVLKGLVLGLGVCGLGWTGYRQSPVWLADQRTATGERRSLLLADGTRLTLNTASAVDIRYDAQQRLIILRAGEILLETGKDARPLKVRSLHGEMRALGTRFTVRQYAELTQLDVLEHAVAVRNQPSGAEVRVDAGMGLRFGHGALPSVYAGDPNRAEWQHGRLVIDGWRLDQVLEELQRYRPGVITCASEVAGLRVSGAYPLDDTDRALTALAQALPLRIDSRTRYWVRVRGLG